MVEAVLLLLLLPTIHTVNLLLILASSAIAGQYGSYDSYSKPPPPSYNSYNSYSNPPPPSYDSYGGSGGGSSGNRCGSSWEDANSNCGTPCESDDGPCGGLWCYAGLDQSVCNGGGSPPPPPPSYNSYSQPPPPQMGSWNTDNPSNWAWATGCDFQGNDMSTSNCAAQDCGPACRSTDGCTHFSWTPPNNCWLKSNDVSESDAFASSTPGIICGLVTSSPPPPPPSYDSYNSNSQPPPPQMGSWNTDNPSNWAWATGCDFQGNDMSTSNCGAQDCGPACRSTGGCTHFSWTPPNNCWLKSNDVSQSDAFASSTPGILCGLMTSPPPPPPDNYAIGDLDAAVVDTSSTTQSSSDSIPTWAVALIVIGSLVIVALLVVIVQLSLLAKERRSEKI